MTISAVLGVVLGVHLIESNYRRSLVLSGGDFHIFLEDPIAIAFFVLAAIIMIGSLVNGTPLVVVQRTERWFYVAAVCNLGPTGVWSDTAHVPLSRCY